MASRFGLLAALALSLTFFWDAVFLRPVKLLVVLVHEMWHALSALAFGLQLDQIKLTWNESGETLVSGDISTTAFIVIVLAGYPGTALTGSFLLRRGLIADYERTGAGVFALILLYMTYLFTNVTDPGFLTGAGWAIAIGLSAMHTTAARISLTATGVIFIFYSLFDLFDFTRNLLATDAGILAHYLVNNGYSTSSVTALAGTVSVFLSLTIIVLLYAVLKPAVSHVLAVSADADFSGSEPEMNPASQEDTAESFPEIPDPAAKPVGITADIENQSAEIAADFESEPAGFVPDPDEYAKEDEYNEPAYLRVQPATNDDRFYQFLVDPEDSAKKIPE